MIKKINRISYYLVLSATIAFLVCGCKKKAEVAPPSPPQPQAPQVAKPPVPVPVQKQVSTSKANQVTGNSLDFNVLKDPFKPFVAETKEAPASKKNRFGQVLPILNYDVPQFKISGIIVGLKENSAMIVDPTGKPYVVKVGMDIGRNNGRITKIAPNFIEIFEQFRDEDGKLIKKTVRLTLPKKE
jgi:type IV pilus assembly protein PilP